MTDDVGGGGVVVRCLRVGSQWWSAELVSGHPEQGAGIWAVGLEIRPSLSEGEITG